MYVLRRLAEAVQAETIPIYVWDHVQMLPYQVRAALPSCSARLSSDKIMRTLGAVEVFMHTSGQICLSHRRMSWTGRNLRWSCIARM